MSELMKRQNDFPHHTVAIYVVNGGHCNQRFEEDGMIMVEIAMRQRAQDGNLLFDLVKPRRVGQCNCW